MESIRWTTASSSTLSDNATERQPLCHPSQDFEATILFTMSVLGMMANIALVVLVCLKKPSKRYHQSWSQGLLLHQALVDLGRAVLLIFLGTSVLICQKLSKCYLVDTSFLLLATVSTVNMLTLLINDAPIFPEHEQLGSISAAVAGANRLRSAQSWLEVDAQMDMHEGAATTAGDSPSCILFAIFIIWFSCLTIHLGPTFFSGGLTNNEGRLDTCALVYQPTRHYVLNVLWALINLLCAALMAIHLRKLHRDIHKSNFEAVRLASMVTTLIPLRSESDERSQRDFQGYIEKLEQEGAARVKMFGIILAAYLICWLPLFVVILRKTDPQETFSYEVTVHLAFAHAVVNPLLFLIMYRSLLKNENRESCCSAVCDLFCCLCVPLRHGHGAARRSEATVRPAAPAILSSPAARYMKHERMPGTELAAFRTADVPRPPPSRELSSSQEYDDPPFESNQTMRRQILRKNAQHRHEAAAHMQQQSSLSTSHTSPSPETLCLATILPCRSPHAHHLLHPHSSVHTICHQPLYCRHMHSSTSFHGTSQEDGSMSTEEDIVRHVYHPATHTAHKSVSLEEEQIEELAVIESDS